MNRLRMEVSGMTCDSCNVHVARALERAGAQDVDADWRRGQAVFAADEALGLVRLAEAVRDAGYGPGPVETLETAAEEVRAGAKADYDLLVIGAGSAAFAAAIRPRDRGARVGWWSRGS